MCPWIYYVSQKPKPSGNFQTKLREKSALCLLVFLLVGILPHITFCIYMFNRWLDTEDTGFTVIASYMWTVSVLLSTVIRIASLLYHSRGMAAFFHHIEIQSKISGTRVSFTCPEKFLGLASFLSTSAYTLIGVLSPHFSSHINWYIALLPYLVGHLFAVFVPFSFFVFCKFFEMNLKTACKRVLEAIERSSFSDSRSSKNHAHRTRDIFLKMAENLKATILWNECMKDLLLKFYSDSLSLVFFFSFVNFVNSIYYTLHDYLSSQNPNPNMIILILSELSLLCLVNIPGDDYNNTVSQ